MERNFSKSLGEAQEQHASKKLVARRQSRDDAFKALCTRLDNGEVLSFEAVGRVFGYEFYELLIHALLDAGDASRAIAGAIRRLKDGDETEGDE